MCKFIENIVANANIKKCEKDLKDVTMMDIYEVDTVVKSMAERWDECRGILEICGTDEKKT